MGTILLTTSKINKILYECYIYLKQTTSETIIGDNTWRSPGTNITLADPAPKNCSYPAGAIQYDGTLDITRDLYANVTVRAQSAGTRVFLSGGVNGVPNADFSPSVELTSAGDEKLLTVKMPELVEGSSSDNVDFFIQANKDFTLVSANFSFGQKKDNGVIS